MTDDVRGECIIDLLLAYYGDDFTGSTDVLETLVRGGVETVLFVEPPTETMLQQYPRARAVGIAGNSRTMSPTEMERALPAALAALARLGAPIVHYKVCSTFDSSPDVGSIGRAIELGAAEFDSPWVPLVVGAPRLQRFCVFGNLFARSGLDSAPYRLDRHPTMRQHPVTPMNEADLRLHLARQTSHPIDLVDVLALDQGYDRAAEMLDAVVRRGQKPAPVVLFDTLTQAHLAIVGRLVGEALASRSKPLLAVGSSGLECALRCHWQAEGIAPQPATVELAAAAAVDRAVVVSGSCSPVTERQIAWAMANGYDEVPLEPARLLSREDPAREIDHLADQACSKLAAGRPVIVHLCRGPDDPRRQPAETPAAHRQTSRRLGVILGRVLFSILRQSSVCRVAVTGGDTSGQVARTLGIEALEMVAPLEPGAPLCTARSRNRAVDGIEITFKGGQVGHDDFLATLLRGRAERGLRHLISTQVEPR